MIIIIDENFFAQPRCRLLGNRGETMSRRLEVRFPKVENAQLYKLRFLLADNTTCYELDVTSGESYVSGSLLAQTGKVLCQWIAVGVGENEQYEVVAKSNIFEMFVDDSIDSDGEPVPTYEETADMFERAVTALKEAEKIAPEVSELADKVTDMEKVVKENTEEIRNTIDGIMQQGKNLFDISTAIEGYFVNQNTGVITASSSYFLSDYIKVSPETDYTLSAKSLAAGTTAAFRYFHYDSDKKPISGSGGLENTGKVISFVSPSEAEYVRFSYVYNARDIMLEKGDSETDYEPFTGNKINAAYVDSYTKEESDDKYLQAIPFKLNVPEKMYAQVGIEFNVYFDNIVETHDTDYTFNVECTKGIQLQRCYRVTPEEADVGTHTITITATNKLGQSVSAISTLIISPVNSETDKAVKVLILGDSTVAGGTVVEKMHENFAGSNCTIETLGTRGTAPNNHEGRSGWSAATYRSYEVVSGVANAFYNNGFDVSYYFNTSGVDIPDWFIINLGINDTFSADSDERADVLVKNFINNMNVMISSIKSVSSDIKVGLALTIPPNYSQDAFGKAYKCGQTRDRYKKTNFNLVNLLIETFSGKEESDGIYLIPIYLNLDTLYNMGFETIPINARSTVTYESPIGNGGVHPVESGYWQIADVYTAFLFSKLSEV